MAHSTKLSDALHILVFIHEQQDADLSSVAIAFSLKANPASVRQMMSRLRKAGIIESVVGHAKPTLTKSPNEITMFEVYKAVEGNKPLLHLDTHTNPECGIGVKVQLAIGDFYQEIQEGVNQQMASITLADVINAYKKRVD